MRLIAKAKPIRIRIKSGGEEHSSLDSLRQNLCVQDLWPLIKDKRLSRWLRQLGEVDLAHAIDDLSESQLDFSTYFKVLALFLHDDLVGHHATELYSLFSYWHDNKMKESKAYSSLRDYLLSQYEGAKFMFRQYFEEVSDSQWWNVFCKFENEEDPQFLFEQGKLAFEGFTQSDGRKFKDIVLGKKLIERAANLHYQKAVDFVNSNVFGVARKLAMLTPEAKEKIDDLICKWKQDGIGFITKKTVYDQEIVREVKQLLQEFTSLRKTYTMSNWEAVRAEAEAKYDYLDESDVFFKERKFVLDLVQYFYDKRIPDLFVKLAVDYDYPLAQYMLRNTKITGWTTILFPILTIINPYPSNCIEGYNFTEAKFPSQLNFIVDHLFKY